MSNRQDSRPTFAKTALAFLLSFCMVWGGVPSQALAEARGAAATDDEIVLEDASDDVMVLTDDSDGAATETDDRQPEDVVVEEEEPNGDASSEHASSASITGQQVENGPRNVSTLPDAESIDNNDELFEQYVEQTLEAALPRKGMRLSTESISARDTLTGNDLKAYDALRPMIEEVAAGTRTDTVFEIPLADLGYDGPWSAAQLGITAITDGSGLSQEAKDAANAKVGFDYGRVTRALLSDCPYDLYWFDKTTSYTYLVHQGYRYSNKSIELTGPAKLSLCVAKEYSASDTKGTCTTKGGMLNAVSDAIANAQTIVANHEDEPLYERLKSYKDEICDRTSYNHDAASNGSTPYGNPWQLIWALDNDTETTVVCEGYSKAFKYLFDLSGFSDADCFIAVGTMNGGTGAGNHMWNVVRMDDDRNYLVDVTNCDGDVKAGTYSIGFPDELFMAFGPSGSYADGYTFTTKQRPVPEGNGSYLPGGKTITYIYDNSTQTTFGEANLAISPKAYDPTAVVTKVAVPKAATGLVYNGTSQTGVAPGTGYALSGTAAATNAGAYTATATLADGYAWSDGSTEAKDINWSIARRPATVAVANKAKTYGDADPEFTAQAKGTVGSDTIPYALSRAAGEDVGTYAITATVSPTPQNYDVTIQPGTLTVEQRDIADATVQLSQTSYTYTGTAHKPGIQSATVGGKAIAATGYGISYSENTNAGTATVTLTGKGNYKGAVSSNFTIVPATITGVGAIADQTYTGSDITLDPAMLEVKAGGLMLAADDFSLSYQNNRAIGTASVTVTGKGNFTGAKTANFSIVAPSLANARIASIPDQTYTGSAIEPEPEVTLGDATLTKGSDYELSWANNTNASTADAPATVTVTGIGTYAGEAQGTFRIVPAKLTVRAENVSAIYGDDAPTYSVSYQGFKGADSADSLIGSPVFACDYTKGSDAGTYAITPSGLSSNNYDIAFQKGALTVSPKEVGLSWGETSFTYDGQGHCPSAKASGIIGGDEVTITVTGAQTDAGTYTATATALSNANYTLPANVTKEFTVAKAGNTLAAKRGVSVECGKTAELPALVSGGIGALTWEITTPVEGCSVTGEGLFTAGDVSGTCIVEVRAAGDANHKPASSQIEVQVLDEIESIADAKVTLEQTSYVYDGKAKLPAIASVTFGNEDLRDGTDYEVTETPRDCTHVGTYAYTIQGRGKYSGEVTASFEVTPRPASVSAGDASKVFGQADPALTASVEGTVGSDTLAYHLERETGEDAGTYLIMATGSELQGDYRVTYQNAALTIERAPIATPATANRTYNGTTQTGIPTHVGYRISGQASATNVGTYAAKLTPDANHRWMDGSTDTLSLSWKIAPASLAGAAVSGLGQQTYTGKALTPRPTVKVGGKTLVAGVDYTLVYANNTKPGTATVTIAGTGNYTGTKAAAFAIAKAAQTFSATSANREVLFAATKKRVQTVATPLTVVGAKGKLTYAKAGGAAALSVDTSTGKVGVKKGTKKGNYTIVIRVTAAGDDITSPATKTFSCRVAVVAKLTNPLTAKAVARTAKASVLRKKAATVARPLSVSGAKGKLTYKKVGGAKQLSVNAKTGKVGVKKGTKAGTYTVKIKVSAKGNSSYKARSVTVTCTVAVK